MRCKSRPAWRITITKDTGESTTLKLYRTPFPQQFSPNKRLRSATSIAEAIPCLSWSTVDEILAGLDGPVPSPEVPQPRLESRIEGMQGSNTDSSGRRRAANESGRQLAHVQQRQQQGAQGQAIDDE